MEKFAFEDLDMKKCRICRVFKASAKKSQRLTALDESVIVFLTFL